jgi:hypothetical protein
MAELAKRAPPGVSVHEVSDYTFGGYHGPLKSPPSADGNPRKALIVTWHGRPQRFVFSHEASYCPWFEFPSGAGVCFQFFEGNDGWAELFNEHGRKEANSFVEVLEPGPQRVRVRWTYFGVNQDTGERAYRAIEDFWAFRNGLVLRRQSYVSLMPDNHRGYAREPIEMIGLCPVGRTWRDVLRRAAPSSDERHALAVLDPFSDARYDVYWAPKPTTTWDATRRRAGTPWHRLDDAAGVVLAIPLREGHVFCAFGEASGFPRDATRIKDHSFPDTGGLDWGSRSWDHWPIGWLNSQSHVVDDDSLKTYPNHFAPAGMDLFALPNESVAKGEYWSLCGVSGDDLEPARRIARAWLELGAARIAEPASTESLPDMSFSE